MENTEERPHVPEPEAIVKTWQLLMVPVSKLFMDRRYQRGLVKGQVKKLVDNWDWEKYHPIAISHRADGRYAVISGQQRTTAALELGIEKLPAILKLSIDITGEAKSYLGSGEVANIQASDRFKARLIANDTKAFAIWQEIEKCGFTLRCVEEGKEGYSVDPFGIEAVFAAESIFDKGYLEKTLTTINHSWGNQPTKDMVQGNMLRGVYLAVRHLEQYEIDSEELSKALGKSSIKEILDKGYDRYRSMVHSRSIDAGVAAVLVDQFNYRRREQVPEFSKKAAQVMAGKAAWKNRSEESKAKFIAAGVPANKDTPRIGGKFAKQGHKIK